ncbi:MAG TPA: SURF1 family protein [Anaerolineales bacterium]
MNLLRLLRREWILFTLLVLAGAAVCIALGIWQLNRLRQRRASNAQVSTIQAMAPLELPAEAGSNDLTTMQYRRVNATGMFDGAHQVAILNHYNEGEYGYHLMTPLVMSGGDAILVDRGWIPPETNSSPASWHQYDVTSAVAVHGIIQLSAPAPVFGAATDPTLMPGQTGLDRWIHVNIPRLAQQVPYPLLPVYIEPDPVPGATTPPIPSQDQPDLSDGPHLGYAVQWFGFATIMLVGYPFYVRRRETPSK